MSTVGPAAYVSILELIVKPITACIIGPLWLSCALAASPPVPLPDSTMGKAGGDLIGRINQHNDHQVVDWLDTQLSAAMPSSERSDFRKATLSAVQESGGVDVVSARSLRTSGGALFMLKSHTAQRFAYLLLEPDPADPGRVRDALFTSTENPDEYASWAISVVPTRELIRSLVRAKLDALATHDDFSGCVSIADANQTWLAECRGLAERTFEVPATQTTKFRIGSMDKMFTAVSIGQLVASGKLKWSSRLADVLPDYPDREAAEQITVWQLLHHQAGLGDIFVPEFFEHREQFRRPADYVNLISRQPKVGVPGQHWSYSNAGYVLLGMVIERVSGEPYETYLQSHIFDVAHMTATGFDSQEDVVPLLAIGYFREDPFALGPWKANWMTLPFRGSPAGGGYSTTADLLRFGFALKSGSLLPVQTVAEMFSDEATVSGGERYAAGFDDREVNGYHVRGHNGGAPGMNAALALVWETSQSVAVASNVDGPAAQHLADHVADLLALMAVFR